MTLRSLTRRLLSLALLAAAAAFLALTVHRNWSSLERFDWKVEPLLLSVSVLGLAGVLAWGVWVWSRVLVHFGATGVTTAALQRIWFLSNLARYIPGKVWQFVGAAQLARAAGLSAPLLLTSLVVHVLFSILAAGAVAGVLLPYSALGIGAWRTAGVALSLAAAAALVHPAVINAGLGLATRLTRREVFAWSGSWTDGVRLLLLSVVSWILYGVALHTFVASLAPVGPNAIPALTAANALSFLAGYFAFLPAGIGAREVAMTMLLDPVLPAGIAAVLALASRLWMIAAELLGALLAWLVNRRGGPGPAEAG